MYNGKGMIRELNVFSVFIIMALICVTMNVENTVAQKKDLRTIRREAESRYLKNSHFEVDRHRGNFVLERDEELDKDLVITDGDADIDGEVLGTVIVIDGDIKVSHTGIIRGDAIAISGEIIRRSGSVIIGDEIQTSWRSFVPRSSRTTSSRDRWSRTRNRYDWDYEFDRDFFDEDFLFRYNRVEGLFLGARMINPDWDDGRFLYMYGEGGYGFKSKDWRYTVGLERRFFYEHRLTVGAKAYDLTDSDDFWRIGRYENWIAAFCIKEDFFDYYNRRGFTGYLSQQVDDLMKFELEYRIDTFESMRNKANWTLFGGGKNFRENPAINEGDMRSLNFSAILDTRDRAFSADQGWYVKFDGEYTSPDMESDFDYERYILDVRWYQPLSRYDNLNTRIMLGSSKGQLPVQRGFYLGGIGTLRGTRFKEFAGTSMAMANIEYIFDPNRVLSGPPSWLLEDFRVSFFSDIGVVDMVDIGDYSDMLESDLWKHNVGFGILTQDEDFRVDFAWRTDEQGEPLRITCRINKAF